MKFITLLRGINVGGNKKILMKDLKTLMETIGAKEVQTYIQSGNIIFNGGNESSSEWSDKIKDAIKAQYGFEVPTLTISQQDFETVLMKLPFEAAIEQLHTTFLSEIPSNDSIQKLATVDVKNDEFEIIGKVLYLKCAGKYSDSKLTNTVIESKLKVQATTRNWKTVSAIKTLLS